MTEPSLVPERRRGAAHARFRSRQDYQTPDDFMLAVRNRFGAPEWDLAASAENAKAPNYITKEGDSLSSDWLALTGGALSFLNPEFGNIAPWAEKCARSMQRGCRILFLTPASPGANWFQEWVVPFSHVLELSPRMSFDGKNPFPKDTCLSVYCWGLTGRSHWRWK